MSYLSYDYNFIKDFSKIKNFLIIVAMQSEEEALTRGHLFEEFEIGNIKKINIKSIRIGTSTILMARSGVGLGKAATLTSQVLEALTVDAIILLGIGGAIDDSLEVGDTVVSSQILQHDSVLTTENGTKLIAPGELTLSASANEQVDPFMRCDQKLVSLVSTLSEGINTGKTYIGTILSGSEFASSVERKKYLRSLASDALLVDMEAAAIAMVARNYRKSFVAAKTVADRANPKGTISDDYKTFLSASASKSELILSGIIKMLTEEN